MALERNGLVQRDGRGKFRPGEVFVSYAWRGGAEADLVSVAQPFLDRLGEPPARPSTWAWPAAALVEQIAQVDSTYLIGGTNWVGLLGAAALRGARQGAARLRRRGAAAGPPGPPHQADDHQPRRAGRPTWPRCAAAATR